VEEKRDAEYGRICRRGEKAEEVLHAGQAHKRQAGQGSWPGRPQPGDEARKCIV